MNIKPVVTTLTIFLMTATVAVHAQQQAAADAATGCCSSLKPKSCAVKKSCSSPESTAPVDCASEVEKGCPAKQKGCTPEQIKACSGSKSCTPEQMKAMGCTPEQQKICASQQTDTNTAVSVSDETNSKTALPCGAKKSCGGQKRMRCGMSKTKACQGFAPAETSSE